MTRWGEIKCPRCEELEAQRAKTYQALLEVTKIHDEVEAKLAKALEALQQLVIEYDEVDLAYDEPESMTAAYVVARATLAELKAERP